MTRTISFFHRSSTAPFVNAISVPVWSPTQSQWVLCASGLSGQRRVPEHSKAFYPGLEVSLSKGSNRVQTAAFRSCDQKRTCPWESKVGWR
ncbi:hypothetical protein TGRH88_030290 [Toxoplasma gondii]|uniref:Uncharacterized protein n=1 Tax=Toxoplasma gondii TaxID=5811 RepID=A0A7J6K7C0_TOXGO|nr:hypothetical protein TGRH88_030290 [Toxoplasma gondii]